MIQCSCASSIQWRRGSVDFLYVSPCFVSIIVQRESPFFFQKFVLNHRLSVLLLLMSSKRFNKGDKL
ncbi:Uncharacterized protein APZ42_028511 [Daphnia magna]|uniref:Uncharacterized protein n=1 Tax=Daphnia magna TaxID=35525 RepID=A0A164QFY8_9CRUS|nr:Uncharacterized protein APZ42_028511 [Daphnia magna]